MWPELWTRRLVTSPVTQRRPSSFSSRRFTCVVSSLTVSTRRAGPVGNNSPKSHWDLVCLPIKFEGIIQQTAGWATQTLSADFQSARIPAFRAPRRLSEREPPCSRTMSHHGGLAEQDSPRSSNFGAGALRCIAERSFLFPAELRLEEAPIPAEFSSPFR